MEYIRFKTGIPGIIPPDCSELIPPPPTESEEIETTVSSEKTALRKGVTKTSLTRRMMPCNKVNKKQDNI
jgi:hypothetical protein